MDEFSNHLKVEDEYGNRYTLSGKSWEGGQGKVTIDSTGKFAIKQLVSMQKEKPVDRERIRQQINKVKIMPFDNLPVAKPLALLKAPALGYVMEFLTGMVPIHSLICPPPEIAKEDTNQLLDWYIKTGGLRRRLQILARLATVINRLHSKGLVYGDLSSNNVFISFSLDHTEVYLIDLDNLCYESSAGDSFIGTPFFQAPEVYNRQRGINTLTDAFSFSVLAFETLALGHPFMGDIVIYGNPDIYEKEAQSGKLPWVFHNTDNTNSSSQVLPKDLMFSEGLFKLLRTTFEDGLLDCRKRPGLSQWEKSLYAAA